jgi:hypothetical protein
LYALAIVGIVTHYYRGDTASRLRWGPLCGVAGATVYLGLAVDPSTDWAWVYVFVLSIGIPSYIEYLKEEEPVATARVTQSVLSGRLSSALTRHLEHIEVSIDRVRKMVRTDLPLLTVGLYSLTVGLSIIFALTFLLASAYPIVVQWQDLHLQQLIMAITYTLFSVFSLIVAAVFSSLVKKTRFVVLSVNHSDANLESDAAAERRALVKDAHRRLAVFLVVFMVPILCALNTAPAIPTSLLCC